MPKSLSCIPVVSIVCGRLTELKLCEVGAVHLPLETLRGYIRSIYCKQ